MTGEKKRTPMTDALSALASPMTRHALADSIGCSYESAAQHVARLQARRQVEPCGVERGPRGKCWRTVFRAVQQAAA